MATAPIFTLRTVTESGALDRYLPDFTKIDMSPVYCDAGTVKFDYPIEGRNFSLLQEDLEIAVLMNGVEIPELRSTIETLEGDDADDAEGGALWSFTCRTFAGKLSNAIVYPDGWTQGSSVKPVAPSWNQKTVGNILGTLFNAARTRGSLAGFTWDFNNTTDSEGNAWTYLIDYAPDIGKDYLAVLKELNDGGFCEWRVEGRKIYVWNYEAMGVDRSIGAKPLHFRKGRDVRESPRKIDARNLKSTVLMGGSDNTVMNELSDPTALQTYGRREVYHSFGSTPNGAVAWNASTLKRMGETLLDTMDKPQVEVTHGLHFETEDNPRPITNFNIGDWALTDVGRGVERFRVLQWVMSLSAAGEVTGSVTMNWMFNTQLSQVNSAIAAVTNGSTNAGSAPKNDGIAPAQVAPPVPTSATYFVNNIPRDNLTVQWSEVTTNSDGSDIADLDYYEVRWKYTSDSFWRPSQRVEADTTVAGFTNLDPGAGVLVQVRASDVWNNHGAWSTAVAHTLAGDEIAPNKPESPLVNSQVGVLRISWTGLDYQGNPMPVDLAGVEVHVSTLDFTPDNTTKKDVLPPGVLVTSLADLEYGQEYWVKLVAFDTTGNKSDPSDTTETSHTVLQQVVSTEIGTGQVGLAQTSFSDVGNLVEDGSFELAGKREDRQVLIGEQHLVFDNTTSSNGSWSLRSDEWPTSSEQILLQGSLPVKAGERVFGAADYRQSADVPTDSYLTVGIRWVSKLGEYLDFQGFVSNVYYTLTDNGFAARDDAWHRRVTATSQQAPPGVAYAEIWLITENRGTGTIWIDAVEVRKQIDTLMIGEAAITRALIADLAVNDAKIQDLNVGKLRAGTLIADITMSARIKTSDTGARVEMNEGGIGAWSSSGTQTLTVAGADGSITMLGQLKSGNTGNRVEINPTATRLPEIRFYPSSGNNYSFLNAFSPSGSSYANIGLNSGLFTANGVSTYARLYMTSTGTFLHYVKDDPNGDGVLGPQLRLLSDEIALEWVGSDGNKRGFGTFQDGGTIIGYSDPNSVTNDTNITFQGNGKIKFVGRFDDYFSADNDQAVMTGAVGFSGVAGVIVSYGTTMLSTPAVVCTLYQTSGTIPDKTWVSSRNTTSFTFNTDINANAQCQYWAFRL